MFFWRKLFFNNGSLLQSGKGEVGDFQRKFQLSIDWGDIVEELDCYLEVEFWEVEDGVSVFGVFQFNMVFFSYLKI